MKSRYEKGFSLIELLIVVVIIGIVAALAVKALFVALTFLGHASLWAAIAADMGVSLLVIFNALRPLRAA